MGELGTAEEWWSMDVKAQEERAERAKEIATDAANNCFLSDRGGELEKTFPPEVADAAMASVKFSALGQVQVELQPQASVERKSLLQSQTRSLSLDIEKDA